MISPPMIENKTENVIVKNCDHGPLTFVVERNLKLDWSNDWSKYTLSLEFGSSVVEDASPPACNINFNGTFLLPQPLPVARNYLRMPPLPFCFTMDSREGYHMTYYWFFL